MATKTGTLRVIEPATEQVLAELQEATVEDAFVAIGKKLHGRGQELSPAQTSHSYAPHVIAKQPEAVGIKKVELIAALNRLLEQGRVRVERLKQGTVREKGVIRF